MTVGELIAELQRFNQNVPLHFVASNDLEQKIDEIGEYARGVFIDFVEGE